MCIGHCCLKAGDTGSSFCGNWDMAGVWWSWLWLWWKEGFCIKIDVWVLSLFAWWQKIRVWRHLLDTSQATSIGTDQRVYVNLKYCLFSQRFWIWMFWSSVPELQWDCTCKPLERKPLVVLLYCASAQILSWSQNVESLVQTFQFDLWCALGSGFWWCVSAMQCLQCQAY